MKKTLLSAASFAVVAVSAIAAAPTTSEAIPAFARQTGAACLSCHFQTFPAINSFGRSFKMNAFTDVGEQALIEDDNLSLPAVLNSSFVLRAQFTQSKANNGAVTTTWNIPADAVLLMAGRVGSNTGAFVEFDGGAANWQLLNSFDFDGVKGGLNIQNTGFGATAAIEVSNVFGQHGGKLNGKALSAVENIIRGVDLTANGTVVTGGKANTTSVAAWVGNETFLVQLAGVAFTDATKVTNASFVPMVRALYIADLGAAELMIGGGIVSGTQNAETAGVTAVTSQGVSAQFIDVQVQGEAGDMSYGIYADFVTSKAKTATGAAAGSNLFALGQGYASNSKLDGYSLRAEVSPMHKVMLGLGVGQLKNTTNGVGSVVTKVQSTQLAFTYEIYQNMEFNSWYKIDTTSVSNAADTKVKTLFAEVEALF